MAEGGELFGREGQTHHLKKESMNFDAGFPFSEHFSCPLAGEFMGVNDFPGFDTSYMSFTQFLQTKIPADYLRGSHLDVSCGSEVLNSGEVADPVPEAATTQQSSDSSSTTEAVDEDSGKSTKDRSSAVDDAQEKNPCRLSSLAVDSLPDYGTTEDVSGMWTFSNLFWLICGCSVSIFGVAFPQEQGKEERREKATAAALCFHDQKRGGSSRRWLQMEEIRPKSCEEQSLSEVCIVSVCVCARTPSLSPTTLDDDSDFAFHVSYYRCTSQKCSVKKRVERSFQDPSIVITTYEGQHTHQSPATMRGTSTGIGGGCGIMGMHPFASTNSTAGYRFFPAELPVHLSDTSSQLNANPFLMQQAASNPFFHQAQQLGQLPDYGLLQDIIPSFNGREQ
ncbi:putative WRKY transcription factor 71 [Nymphaea thermarum]|nr:putative WRKY transcription factor 71 [Nymphaea thermarum]